MSTTPKANVKRRYKHAYLAMNTVSSSDPWCIFKSPASRRYLASGKTAMHAWKAAAKAIAVPREK